MVEEVRSCDQTTRFLEPLPQTSDSILSLFDTLAVISTQPSVVGEVSVYCADGSTMPGLRALKKIQ